MNFEGIVIAFTNYNMEMHIGKKLCAYEHNTKENEYNVIVSVCKSLSFKSSSMYCNVCIVYMKFF